MTKKRTIPGDFGDCEITAVGFEHPNVIVKIYDRNEADFYATIFSGVEYVLLESNHVQNVVSFLHVFESARDGLENEEFADWLRERGLSGEIERLTGNHRICFLSPIAGAQVLIIYEEVSLN